MRIEDIRELLRRYPAVAEVPLEQLEEFTRAGMVQVMFHGGREAGMALGLFDQKPGESREEWRKRLEQFVNSWAVEEPPGKIDIEQAVPVGGMTCCSSTRPRLPGPPYWMISSPSSMIARAFIQSPTCWLTAGGASICPRLHRNSSAA